METARAVRRAPGGLRIRGALPPAGAALAVTFLAQVAYVLAPGSRAALSTVVVTALAVTTTLIAAAAWGAARAASALLLVAAGALGVEVLGLRTGFPFGDYTYGDALRPQVGGVPVIVPLAWFAMGLPAREVALRISDRRLPRIALAATALTAWDLFLDPQMTVEGFWTWPHGGAYAGIPVGNFGGWLLAAAVLLGAVDLVAPRGRRSAGLLAVYGFVAVMETVGFLLFFRREVVAVAGGLAMGCALAAAVLRTRRRAPAGG